MIILFPYESDCQKIEVKNYIDLALINTFQVIFKTRSDVPEERQLAEYGLSLNYHPNFKVISDTAQALKESDVVAGAYSTFLYEAVEMLKPVIYLETSSDFGEGIAQNGLATVVSGPADLARALKEVRALSKKELEDRRVKLLGDSPKLMQDTINSLLRNESEN